MNSKLPEFLIEMLEEQYGKENTKKIIQGYDTKRKTTFRVNTLKATIKEVENLLQEKQLQYKKVEWSQEAFILESATEKEIRNLSIYEEGRIYLQSLSSMLPPIILQPKEGTDILDMAAAPGGKTTRNSGTNQ